MPETRVTDNVDVDAAVRLSRRGERFAARRLLWAESRRSRVQKCGKVAVSEVGVQVKASGHGAERRAGFGGVYTCGSVWSCPVCSDKIQAHRRGEIAEALAAARARGWTVAFVTLTMRHHKRDGLGELWLALSNAWTRATSGSGRWWAEAEATLGVRGYVRTVETTVGANGWHVHVHALMFLDDRGHPVKRAHLLGAGMFERWANALERRGFRPGERHGLDVQVVEPDSDTDVAEYLTKNTYSSTRSESSAAFEVTGSFAKKGRGGNRTPFELLAECHGGLLEEAERLELLKLWHEWERVSAGKLQMLWSRDYRCKAHRHLDLTKGAGQLEHAVCDLERREHLERTGERIAGCRVGIRRQLGMTADQLEDEEVLERDQLEGDVLTTLTPREWTHTVRRRLELEVLRLAEVDDGGRALQAWRVQTFAALYHEPPTLE